MANELKKARSGGVANPAPIPSLVGLSPEDVFARLVHTGQETIAQGTGASVSEDGAGLADPLRTLVDGMVRILELHPSSKRRSPPKGRR